MKIFTNKYILTCIPIFLKSDSLKKEFLENIFRSDQEIRSVWQKSSSNTNSTDTDKEIVIKEVRIIDSINLLKIECYLSAYGYPNKNKIKGVANMVPWLIIHHATKNEARFRNFPVILKAYREHDIKDEQLKMYMCRALSMHNKKKGFNYYYKKNIEKLILKTNRIYDRGCSW